MKLAVCDDDARILSCFEKIFSQQRLTDNLEWSLFSDADSLLEACGSTEFDLIYMDIMLGEASGIETARKAFSLIPSVRVVFVTAHPLDYCQKIFGNIGQGRRPFGFITKPMDESEILKYICLALEEMDSSVRFLVFSRWGVEYQLALSAVWYIESEGRKAYIHCGDSSIEVYDKLGTLWEQLDDRFVRCHQSFIVNLDRVTDMRRDALVITRGDGTEHPIRISRNRQKETRLKYFEYKGRTTI